MLFFFYCCFLCFQRTEFLFQMHKSIIGSHRLGETTIASGVLADGLVIVLDDTFTSFISGLSLLFLIKELLYF